MTDASQIFVFFACTACGIASGVLYDVIFCACYPIRAKWVHIVADIFFFLLFAGLYIFVSVMFSLPSFRLYMLCACFIGFFLYLKSFHKIVAFFMEKIYNGFSQRKKQQKEEQQCSKKMRRSVPRKKRRELQ